MSAQSTSNGRERDVSPVAPKIQRTRLAERNRHYMNLPKYAYSDLTVFMRTGKNDYLNITDYSETDRTNEHVAFQSDAPFAIMFCSLFYSSFKDKGIKPYICDVTLEELCDLAGVHDASFVKRFGEANKDLLAIFCAREIVDYQHGKIVREANNRYSFYRQTHIREDKGYKKRKAVVLTKEFYEA